MAGADAQADAIAFLAGTPLFAGLNADALPDIAMASTPFWIAAGETLFRQEDAADGVYLIRSGRLAIAARAPGDDLISVNAAGPGDLIGELSLLDGARRSASAIAEADTDGLFIGLVRFRGMAAFGRPAAFAVLDRVRREVARRSRSTLVAILERPASLVAPAGEGSFAQGPTDGLDDMFAGLARFVGLGMDGARTIAALCTRIDAPRGAVLADAGDVADALYFVLRGALRNGLPRGGAIEPLAVLGPGEVAGTIPAIDRERYALRLESRENAIVLALPFVAFDALCASHSETAHALLDIVNRQLVRDLRRMTRHLGRADALARFNGQGEAGHV